MKETSYKKYWKDVGARHCSKFLSCIIKKTLKIKRRE